MFWDIIYELAERGTTIMVTTHFMDEVEHCDSIGFIYEGNLIADDTPINLKNGLPGILLEIPAQDPMDLVTRLIAKKREILDVYPYGTSVHVLIHKEHIEEYQKYNVRIITPSLEDVFVYYVKTKRKEMVV
jgi:ABC-2 type transport system ATP-binding protein